MAALIEVTIRDDRSLERRTGWVNPEHIMAILPGRPYGSSSYVESYGARIVMAAQNKVGSAEVPLEINTRETVDELAIRVREGHAQAPDA